MQITTSKNKTFEVEHIGVPLRDESRVIIELADSRPFAEIAADFDGLESIKRKKDVSKTKTSVYDVYEGFTKLVGMQENKAAGTVRLTLEKGDAV